MSKLYEKLLNEERLGPPEPYDPNNPEHNDPKKYKLYSGNVWKHTISALRANKVLDPIVNFAILLHDIGKTTTLAYKEGNPTYYGHAEESVDLINDLADRLKLSNVEREKILFATINHMRFHEILHMKPSKIVKMVTDDNFDVLVAVAKADNQSRMHMSSSEKEFEDIVKKAVEIKEKWGIKMVNKTMKVVDGNHVIELTNSKPSPKIGKTIKIVSDWIIDYGIKNQKQIDNYIKEVYFSL